MSCARRLPLAGESFKFRQGVVQSVFLENVRHGHRVQFLLGVPEHPAKCRIWVLEHLRFNVGDQDTNGSWFTDARYLCSASCFSR